MPRVSSQDLLFVSKAGKEKLDTMAAGASLVDRTGYPIKELRIKATLDRLAFARSILQNAELALKSNPKMHRVAISRAYYSMYHAFRAASFFVLGGDDYEKHQELPSKLPGDFPDLAVWANNLKAARLERNKADYDSYPKKDQLFSDTSKEIIKNAKSLIPIVVKYLKKKGCIL